MSVTFSWKLSYLGCVEYEVYGETPVRSIEVHNASASTIEYSRTIFNHGDDPTSFERNVLSAQGGVSINYSEERGYPKHWEPWFYDAFVEHLKAKHAESVASLAAMYDKWNVPENERDVRADLFIPRPIYFDHITQRFETEPWFKQQPEEVRPVRCEVCGSTREHVKIMAFVTGIADPICCEDAEVPHG